MPVSDFIAHLAELFEAFGPVTIRRMFGGHGVFRDGLMFGLVVDDALYLKADEQNRVMFESCGLPSIRVREERKARLALLLPGSGRRIGGPADARRMGATRVRRSTSRESRQERKVLPCTHNLVTRRGVGCPVDRVVLQEEEQ